MGLKMILAAIASIYAASIFAKAELEIPSNLYNWQQDTAISANIEWQQLNKSPMSYQLQMLQSQKDFYLRLYNCTPVPFELWLKSEASGVKAFELSKKGVLKKINATTVHPSLGMAPIDLILIDFHRDQKKDTKEISEPRHLLLELNSNKTLWIKKDNALIQKIEYVDTRHRPIKKWVMTEAVRENQSWQINRARYEDLVNKRQIEIVIKKRQRLNTLTKNSWNELKPISSCLP